jgi:macrolide phosphotransferase
VGDPAEDFAWLIGARDTYLADTVIEAYAEACRTASFRAPDREPDAHLLERARLDAEFALAQWLMRGLDRGLDSVVADAEAMLARLEKDLARRAAAPAVPPAPSPAATAHRDGAGGTGSSAPAH